MQLVMRSHIWLMPLLISLIAPWWHSTYIRSENLIQLPSPSSPPMQLVLHVFSRILFVHGKVVAMRTYCRSHGDQSTRGTSEESCSLLGNHILKNETTGSLLGGSRDENGSSSLVLQAEVAAMKSSLQEMATSLNRRFILEEGKRQIALEWKCLALVMDRTFFYMYLIAIIVSLVVLFPRPNYTN